MISNVFVPLMVAIMKAESIGFEGVSIPFTWPGFEYLLLSLDQVHFGTGYSNRWQALLQIGLVS